MNFINLFLLAIFPLHFLFYTLNPEWNWNPAAPSFLVLLLVLLISHNQATSAHFTSFAGGEVATATEPFIL